MIPLKYQTSSQNRVIGQIISTDGNTITSSGTTIASTDIRLWKYNSTALVSKSTSGATYLSDGVWSVTFSSDDTDTLGAMTVFTHISSGLVTKDVFDVMAANKYDSWVSTTDYLQVDAVQISGTASTDQIASSTEVTDAVWSTTASRTLSSGAISSLTFSSGAISSLAFGAAAISTAALSSGAISTLTISTAAWDQAANSVWSAVRSGFVSTLTMGYTQSTLNWTNISNEVWANSTRTLTAGAAISTTDYDEISSVTWARTIKTLSTTQSFDVTGNITGNLSGSVGSLTDRSSFALSTIAQTAISNEVWNNSTKQLSSAAVVWTAVTRTLTDMSSAVLSTVGLDAIWTASTRSLTSLSSFALSTISQDAISNVVWANSTKKLSTTQSFDVTGNVTGNLSGSVGSVTDRSSFALSTTALDSIYTPYIESTETVKDTLKIIRAESAGASTGGGTSTAVFYSPNSSVARITGTMSSDGNRSNIIFDLT